MLFNFLPLAYLGKGSCKPPEASEPPTLQLVKLLVALVLTRHHILNDGLNSTQNHPVMAEGQHRCYFGIQQWVAVFRNRMIREREYNCTVKTSIGCTRPEGALRTKIYREKSIRYQAHTAVCTGTYSTVL